MRSSRMRVLMTGMAAGAMLVMPAAAEAKPAKRCAKTPSVGYQVQGTLASFTADDPATEAFEGTVSITVTNANKHARESGEIADTDAATPGVQGAGAPSGVLASDSFTATLVGFEDPDTPSVGDTVRIGGKVERTKSKCAPEATSLADRYGALDVRRVTITDEDPDA